MGARCGRRAHHQRLAKAASSIHNGMISFNFVVPSSEPTTTPRVYPSVERLRRLAGPRATRPVTGSRPAAVAGEGIEFAELLFLALGERARRINWRATAARAGCSSTIGCPSGAPTSSSSSTRSEPPRRARRARSTTPCARGRLAERGLSPPARPRRAAASAATSSGSSPAWACASSIGSRTPCSRARSRERTTAGATRASSRAGFSSPQSLIAALTPRLDWRVTRALLHPLPPPGFDRRGRSAPYLADAEAAAGPIAWRTWLLERDRRPNGSPVLDRGRVGDRTSRLRLPSKPRRGTMSGRRFRRCRSCRAWPGAAVLGALAALTAKTPRLEHSAPRCAASSCASSSPLFRGPAPDATVERPAVTAVLAGRWPSLRCSRSPARPWPSWRPLFPPDTAPPPGSSAAAAAALLFLLVAALAVGAARPKTNGRVRAR